MWVDIRTTAHMWVLETELRDPGLVASVLWATLPVLYCLHHLWVTIGHYFFYDNWSELFLLLETDTYFPSAPCSEWSLRDISF